MAENKCNSMSCESESSSPSIVDSNNGKNIDPKTKPTDSKSVNVPKYGTQVPNRVFVGGIPSDVNETEMRQMFAQYGNVVSVKIISDRAGIPRGYGFVTYESEEDAKKVIEENDNLFIKNRKLNVSVAVKKQQYFGYDINPRYVANGGPMYGQRFPVNATNAYYQDIGLCSAEGMPLYQVAVNPQMAVNSGTSGSYPYTYQNSGLYVATQPSVPQHFHSSMPASVHYGVSPLRLPLSSQDNMNSNQQYVHISNTISPPLNHSSQFSVSSTMPLQLGTSHDSNGVNTESAITSAICSLNLIPSPYYTISSNIALPNSTQMACVQNVQLKADNTDFNTDNSLMATNSMTPLMAELLWPQRVPNIQLTDKTAAINRYHYTSKSYNNSNNSLMNKDKRNTSSFNTSQKRYGNHRPKAYNNESQNRNSQMGPNSELKNTDNHESYQSANSSAFQGQSFVKQYPIKAQSHPNNQYIGNDSQQMGSKPTNTGQTLIPKLVNGVQIFALPGLSGNDAENYSYTSGSPLTPPLTPSSHSNSVKNYHKI